MELTKKTTILFPPDLHERLSRLAEKRGTSLGDLVRKACERQYGLSTKARLEAVRQLATMSFPVGDPGAMKRESIPRVEDLLGDSDLLSKPGARP
jgi:adenylylsulfate kinase-like enzyme